MNKILSVILIVAILGAMGALGYVVAVPKTGERFTEFYILGPTGTIEYYPEQLVVGEQAKVTVGIINREDETASYRMEVNINEVIKNEIGPLVLHHGDKWEQEVGFVPTTSGDNQTVEFLLYRQGQSEAYQSLHLWVNVKEPK